MAEAWVFGPSLQSTSLQLRRARRAAFAVSIVILCLVAGGALLGVPSLTLGWVQGGGLQMHRVHDIGWGAFAVVLVCGAAVALLKDPERRPAAMQQLIACLAVGGVSMAASSALTPAHFIRAVSIAAPVAAMIALYPDRKRIVQLGRASPLIVGLSIVGAVPLTRFAVLQIRMQRVDRLSPHGVAFHWGTMATLALAIVGTMFVASIQAPGWRVSAWCAGVALAIFGSASAIDVGYASSVGRAWGASAIALGVVFVAVAELQLRGRSRQRLLGGVS